MRKLATVVILVGLLILGSTVAFAGPWPVTGTGSEVNAPIETTLK